MLKSKAPKKDMTPESARRRAASTIANDGATNSFLGFSYSPYSERSGKLLHGKTKPLGLRRAQ